MPLTVLHVPPRLELLDGLPVIKARYVIDGLERLPAPANIPSNLNPFAAAIIVAIGRRFLEGFAAGFTGVAARVRIGTGKRDRRGREEPGGGGRGGGKDISGKGEVTGCIREEEEEED
ncbi:hypothetical protein BHE74_00035946 [Ensete ventricosum]|nr:hypothetical protein BHE74_00035946 [Ensete ventricosum]RZR83319.1 hypothetical protein BHM03_00009917 [Ensete ventricosum]